MAILQAAYRSASTKPSANQQLVACDSQLLLAVLCLSVLGLVMVGSSSISIADELTGNPLYYFWRQLAYLFVAFSGLFIAYKVPLKVWSQSGLILIFFSLILLVLVFIPGLGKQVNGSARWINLGLFSIQVSEFVKLFAIIYVASYLVRHNDVLKKHPSGFWKPLGLLSIIVFLLLLEPDFGATVVLLATTMGMLWLGGAKLGQFLLSVLFLIGLLALLAVVSPYRMQRLTTFMDPWGDPFNSGFQLTQALIAFGRGEWLGVGLGASVQKLFYLPEAHTDFLFAVMAEEIGLLGGIVVILVFSFIVFRILYIGLRAERHEHAFGGYLAYGIGLWIGLQAFINIGVNMGVLPTKGLTLPFMSYGGSSIVVMCIAIGLVLRVDFETRQYDRYSQNARRARYEGGAT
ncbi:Cell division protein FtsW [hydrothermal vent metagenome]|uniref:peptidoglycan glycosyltransferase n=1 Tax=hydrothermal vent metagenome TaxID=652676 RepID=A0A3B1A128_9ZZZZ